MEEANVNRRNFLRMAGAGALAAALGSAQPLMGTRPGRAAERRPPNIVVILADDLGYADLGCYGNRAVSTPNIDRLAEEGMRFTDFHSNGPMCSPTRAALLTGRYQNRMGIESALGLMRDPPEGYGLPTDEITIAQRLGEAGYKSAVFGKWHLGHQPFEFPMHFGFDEFIGLLCGCGDFISQVNRLGLPDWWRQDELAPEEGDTTTLITDHSIRFIEEHQDQPFFLYVSHLTIHFPWMSTKEDAHRELGEDYTGIEDPANSRLGPHVGSDHMQEIVHGMIADLDRSTGRIIETLRRLKLDENTLVIFTSDNGGYIHYNGLHRGELSDNGPLRGQKTEIWEGGHRVPAIAWWPGRVPAGVTVDDTVLTMDLPPTFLELAGLSPPAEDAPKPFDGVSVKSLLLDEESVPERTLFWRMRTARAVRRGGWKLVRLEDDPPELYNLAEDIGERNNLADEHPGRVEALAQALAEWEAEVDAEYARLDR